MTSVSKTTYGMKTDRRQQLIEVQSIKCHKFNIKLNEGNLKNNIQNYNSTAIIV